MKTRDTWSPYAVGAGIGLLSWVVFALVDHPLGVSTTLAAASGACLMPWLGSEAVGKMAYWSNLSLKADYPTLFVAGMFLGALVGVLWSRSFRWSAVPTVWRERFGNRLLPRLVVAFVGGAAVLYGARMAGGCTSGHGISGSLQLALSSWVFFLTLFVSGVLAARVIFRGTKS